MQDEHPPHRAVSGSAHALVAAVDAVEDAEKALDQRVRVVLGVNNTDFAVLQFLDREQRRGSDVRVGDIAARFGVSSGSATEIVHRLTGAGLVHRVAHPSDARVRRIALTDSATERLEAIVGGVRADLETLLHSIQPGEEARMIELLDQVREIFRSGSSPS
ncbi:MarR family winged helix-turn-helix transcriptional regulator [Amnibacterium setariae]|uniref:MarR family transcriptional regulator n=1 Tax=Amnibacterium setariae TaxID=2306585 RepID=A0A3A1TWC3_9MICO|nr:MarR family transcriptional regulator [Amnibacterium setariae]RIX27908.1 MarR family transcriptional regulator [Amnibacterium setariae]